MAEERGITIKFRGDDTNFLSAVKKVNGEIKATKSEISLLNKQLKFDPKNVDALSKKFDLLKQREKQLTEQTKVLEDGLKQIDPNTKEWDNYNRQLQKASSELASIRNEIEGLPTAKLAIASENFLEWGEKLENVGEKVENVGKKLSVLSAGIIGLGSAGVKYNAQLEQYQTAYTTLIGDAEKASQTIKEIQDSAGKTPFSTESLIEANQYLISAGVEAEESQKMILALGDAISATGGGSSELSRMAQNLQQIKNLGKASTQDIKQFANAGINIYGLLAETTGKSVDELKEMDITYDELLNAFSKASSEGGMYFGAMEKQSETLSGTISTLKDQINQLLGELTAELMPIIKNVLQYITNFIKKLKEMSPEQKNMVLRIAEVVAVLGPALTILGNLITTFGGLSSGLGAIMKNKNIIKFFADVSTNGGKLGGVLKVIFKAVKSLISPFSVLVGVLGFLYATNEDVRNEINKLVATFVSLFKPAIELIIAVVRILWNVFQQVVGVLGTLWGKLQESRAVQVFISAIKQVISWIQSLLEWVKSLISWLGTVANWFLDVIDLAKDFNDVSNNSRYSLNGNSISVINSGGFMSSGGMMAGGITVNNTFTIHNANSIDKSTVLSWADVMTERINENLGRLI